MNASFDYKFGKFTIPKMFVLHSSKHFFSLVPPNPILKGHILICSKREVPSLSDLTNEEIFDYSLTLQYISKRVELYQNVTSSTISIQDGEDAGQVINHFHAHVIPRAKGDLNSNDEVYSKLNHFDEDFIREFTELLQNDKNKQELKDEVENFKNFILKTYIY